MPPRSDPNFTDEIDLSVSHFAGCVAQSSFRCLLAALLSSVAVSDDDCDEKGPALRPRIPGGDGFQHFASSRLSLRLFCFR